MIKTAVYNWVYSHWVSLQLGQHEPIARNVRVGCVLWDVCFDMMQRMRLINIK